MSTSKLQRFVQLVVYAVVAVTALLILQTIAGVGCVTVHLPIKINQIKELK